jgi:hypothetical protein
MNTILMARLRRSNGQSNHQETEDPNHHDPECPGHAPTKENHSPGWKKTDQKISCGLSQEHYQVSKVIWITALEDSAKGQVDDPASDQHRSHMHKG